MKKRGRPPAPANDGQSSTGGEASPAKKKPKKEHKPLPESKFGGVTEEEVCKLVLPDHMKPGLDIIFVRANGCVHALRQHM